MIVRTKSIGWITGLALLLVPVLRADLTTFNIDQMVPDYDDTGLQNTQTLSGYSNLIASIDVTLRISGDPLASIGDLYVSLQCENGGYAVLLNRIGKTASSPLGYDINGVDLTFSFGSNDIHLAETFLPSYDGDGRLTGIWGADGRDIDPNLVLDTNARTALLDAFAGIDPNGDWTLFVADTALNGTARLDSWGMNVVAVPEPATFILFGGPCLAAFFLRRHCSPNESRGG